MNIRALTGFLDPGWPLESRRIASLATGIQLGLGVPSPCFS